MPLATALQYPFPYKTLDATIQGGSGVSPSFVNGTFSGNVTVAGTTTTNSLVVTNNVTAAAFVGQNSLNGKLRSSEQNLYNTAGSNAESGFQALSDNASSYVDYNIIGSTNSANPDTGVIRAFTTNGLIINTTGATKTTQLQSGGVTQVSITTAGATVSGVLTGTGGANLNTIGATTPGTGLFTTLAASTSITASAGNITATSGNLIATVGNITALGALSNIYGATLQSVVATGTAPLTVASTTNVPNLNASSLNGASFAAPGAIGGTTASSSVFTTIGASTSINAGGSATITSGGLITANGSLTVSLGSTTLVPIKPATFTGLVAINTGGVLSSVSSGASITGIYGASALVPTVPSGGTAGQYLTSGAGPSAALSWFSPTAPVQIDYLSGTTVTLGAGIFAGCIYYLFELWGSGGGSAGSGSTQPPGSAGSNSTVTFTGGGGGVLTAKFGINSTTSAGAAGGGISTNTTVFPGLVGNASLLQGNPGAGVSYDGSAVSGFNYAGGVGGGTTLGGGGASGPNSTGFAPQDTTCGAGAGGAGCTITGAFPIGGAGSGSYAKMYISSSVTSVVYVQGNAGTAGTAGTSGNAGAAGATGRLRVTGFLV